MPENDCYIQFIYDSKTMAYVTSIGFVKNLMSLAEKYV